MRHTKKITAITRDEFNRRVDEIALHEVALAALEAQRAEKLQKIEQQFGERIETHKRAIDDLIESCERYASEHRTELLGDKKSAETAGAVFGFRLGNPTVKPEPKFTEAKVVAHLLATGESSFYAQKTRLNKDAVLAEFSRIGDADARSEFLTRLHLRVVQAEAFWVEPKADQKAPKE